MQSHQQPLFVEDIYEAIRHAVQWLGGAKVVGHDLWPSLTPAKAAEKLNDCLNRDRAQKLDPEEIQQISRQAGLAGCHTIAHFQASNAGYAEPSWRAPKDENKEAQAQFVAAVKYIKSLEKKLGIPQ